MIYTLHVLYMGLCYCDLLHCRDEIDEELLAFVDSLIKRSTDTSTTSPSTVLDGQASSDIKATNAKVEALRILKLVENRLRAEINSKCNSDIRLLSQLLALGDAQVSQTYNCLLTDFSILLL